MVDGGGARVDAIRAEFRGVKRARVSFAVHAATAAAVSTRHSGDGENRDGSHDIHEILFPPVTLGPKHNFQKPV